jgi:tRNA(Ile)-lysidine synthase
MGHHFDDQMETFYMNLVRKAGIDGLSCMAEIDGKKVRPLLAYRKKELYRFATDQHIVWREDSSNQKNTYQRNKWRNLILPQLEAEFPDLADSVACLIVAFQETKKSEDQAIDELLNATQFPCERWSKLSVKQQITVLKSKGFSANVYKEVDKLISTQKGKVIHGKAYDIHKESDYLFFNLKTQQDLQPRLIVKVVENLPSHFDKTAIYLDAHKLHGELKVREWQQGDRIASLGMKGSQLVSDILKDAKVHSHEKKSVYVLCDDATIHAVIGYKIGRKGLASANSKQIVRVKIEFV